MRLGSGFVPDRTFPLNLRSFEGSVDQTKGLVRLTDLFFQHSEINVRFDPKAVHLCATAQLNKRSLRLAVLTESETGLP